MVIQPLATRTRHAGWILEILNTDELKSNLNKQKHLESFLKREINIPTYIMKSEIAFSWILILNLEFRIEYEYLCMPNSW